MDEGNGAEGILGRRVMHCYCAWSMGFHSGVRKRAPTRERPYWARGGLAKKFREGALIATMNCRWRILSLGHRHITTNLDCTNASGCTDRSKLEEIARTQSQGTDI
eukprot:4817758-Pyramimonas_sp.AAC.1